MKFTLLKDPKISWPASLHALLASIDEDVLLLDSLDRKVPVGDDGLVDRRVVSVEEKEQKEGFLTFRAGNGWWRRRR